MKTTETRVAKMDEKKSIRETVRKKRDSMTAGSVEAKSSAIAENLMGIIEYRKAKAVLFYAAKGNEVATRNLIEKALKEGKRVLLPITNAAAREIEVAEITDYDSDLKKGAFGIMEPNTDRKMKTSGAEAGEKIDAVIVPGIAFDREGHRLGYGHGYYDKLLHRLAGNENGRKGSIVKIGLAYDCQIVEKLPRESHDLPMDLIVTETVVIKY